MPFRANAHHIGSIALAGLFGCVDAQPTTYDITADLSAGARGIDYAFAYPSPTSIHADHYAFAVRYLSYDPGKDISKSEAESLWAHGVDIVSNWEAGGTDTLEGYDEGRAEAQQADSEALAAGMPATRPIYFSIDFDAASDQQAAINDYFDGVASVLGRDRTGAYGGYYPIQRLFDAGKITWGWQTYAWSGGLWESRAQLRQIENDITVGGLGGCCDLDEAEAVDIGQWHRTSTTTTSSGGGFRTSRRVTQNSDGRLEMFARAPDQAIFHDWQTKPNAGWNGWASLGGSTTQDPIVASDADGRLEVFVIAGGHLYERFQLVGGGWFDTWRDQGGDNLVGEPAALENADGRLEVFARDESGALWHKWQHTANGPWDDWASLGGVITSNPNVGRNKDGRLEVFALGSNDELFHIWQVSAGGTWSAWDGFGGIKLEGTPHVGDNADGRLEVFVTGSDRKLHHIAELAQGGWSGWIDGGTFEVVGEPAMARNRDGRMEVFARGSDNSLWHLWQTAPNEGWTDGTRIDSTNGLASSPDVAPNADGRLEAFWRASNGAVKTVFQTTPGGSWSAESSFGGDVSDF
jgi:hypothetical protein